MNNILYTINGNYPDKYFKFTITPENMSLSARKHEHDITGVYGLENAVKNKSEIGHHHQAVYSIQVNDNAVVGDIVIQGQDNVQAVISGSTVTLSIQSESVTGNVAGVKNANPGRRSNMIAFHLGNKFETDTDTEFIVFQEDTI